MLLGTSYSTGRATLVRLASYIAHCKVGSDRLKKVGIEISSSVFRKVYFNNYSINFIIKKVDTFALIILHLFLISDLCLHC